MNITWSQITIAYVLGNLVLMFFFTIVTAVGGAFDLKYMFQELHQKTIDELDDGRVIHSEKTNESDK